MRAHAHEREPHTHTQAKNKNKIIKQIDEVMRMTSVGTDNDVDAQNYTLKVQPAARKKAYLWHNLCHDN